MSSTACHHADDSASGLLTLYVSHEHHGFEVLLSKRLKRFAHICSTLYAFGKKVLLNKRLKRIAHICSTLYAFGKKIRL